MDPKVVGSNLHHSPYNRRSNLAVFYCLFVRFLYIYILVKRFITIFLFLTFLFSGCARKPLYLRGTSEALQISTFINISADVLVNLNADIRANLDYKWDETVYGKLGYDTAEYVQSKIFTYYGKGRNQKELYTTERYSIGRRNTTSIRTNILYDMLLFTETRKSKYFNSPNYSFYIVEADSAATKAVHYSESFPVIPQAEEQFATNVEELYIDSDDENLESEVVDGVLTYYYNLNLNLEPVSYIYIIEVAIEDDDDRYSMDYDSCLYMGISGVATQAELFTRKTTNERGLIESHNVKKVQSFDGKCMFAERFVTYGLVRDYNSSWGYAGLTYELGIEFRLSDGTIKKGRLDISRELMAKPKGGVIKILIKNSAINREEPSSGGGFNVDVEGWQEVVNVEIEI